MRAQLFIEGYELELKDDVQFLLNREFEELSNPTTIINSWSKTVSIPFSEKNNRIFGYIYKPNKVIVSDGTPDSYKRMNIYFDPTKQLDFRLIYNSTLMMEGYAKMNSIKQKGNEGSYEITLFGQLGKIFQQMKKITFDTTTEDSSFLINGADYLSEYNIKDLVYQSWTTAGQVYKELYKVGDSRYYATDIIGFAPNNSFSEDFDYETFQWFNSDNNAQEAVQFADVLTNSSFFEITHVDADTAIPNGLLPREIGEYRSYNQLPFIYFNKLFQIFQQKAEELTGYEFVLDENWFNKQNPYWFNLVYMLQPFGQKDEKKVSNAYHITPWNDIMWDGRNLNTNTQTTTFMAYETSVESYPIANGWRANPMLLNMSDLYSINANSYFPIILQVDACYYLSERRNIKIIRSNGIAFEVCFYNNDTNEKIASKKCLLVQPDFNGSRSGYDQVFEVGDLPHAGGYYDEYEIPLNITFPITSMNSGSQVRLEMNARWLNTNGPFVRGTTTLTTYQPEHIYLRSNMIIDYAFNVDVIKGSHRSFTHFTLNDLWNKDFNLFDEIINYCKMMRIFIYTDDTRKKIYFKPYNKYFQDFTITDWTDKLDRSKDMVIKPITFENKYVLFNYEDNKTKIGEAYREKYGLDFGEYRLSTDYNFNTETKELFEKAKIKNGIINTDNVLSWTNLYDNKKIVYSFPNELSVCNKDKDGKQVDTFGTYFFHNGLTTFNTEPELAMRDVFISDDTNFQRANSKYFYSQATGDRIQVTTYPKLDVVRDDNICLFNIPKENYTYLNNYVGKHSLYYNLWNKYLDEKYSIQNRLVTCYLKLTPKDWNNFEFRNFIKIDNVVYLVNKIYDYNITSNETTKVDLISISDIEAYTDVNYVVEPKYIELSTNDITIPYDYYKRIKLRSTGDWELQEDDYRDYLTVTPTDGSAGEYDIIIGTLDENHGYTLHFRLMEGNDIIDQTALKVTVGGTSTITTDNWIKYLSPNSTANFTVTSSTPWTLYRSTPNPVVSIYPTSGNAGTTNVTMVSGSDTGVANFYIENTGGDMVMERGVVQ